MRDHGTRASFIAGCTCDPCRDANSRYCKEWRWRSRNSGHANIDNGRVRDHIETLGISYTALGVLSGISRGTIARIHQGKTKRVRPVVASAILAVDVDNITGRHYISARGSRRRLQALAAIGWSGSVLSERIGYTRANLHLMQRGDRNNITGDIRQRISTVYDELENVHPVGTTRVERGAIARTKSEAARRGYLPPAAWDDIDNDTEPAKLIDRKQDTLAEFEWLTSFGESEEQAMKRLGVTRSAIEHARIRAGRKAA